MPISKFVDKVAFEAEGGYYNIPGCRGHKVHAGGHRIEHDGSVRFDERHPKRIWNLLKKAVAEKKVSGGNNPRSYFMPGEYVSEPFSSVEKASQKLVECWPDRTNATCGLHFHLSVRNPSFYSRLMEPDFYKYLKDSLAAFAEAEELNRIFMERFYNKSDWAKRYCRDEFIPLRQAYTKRKEYNDPNRSRYTMLNFCHGLHETMEIRVFTTHMPLKRAVNCLLWYVHTVDTFLHENYESYCNTKLVEEQIDVEAEVEEASKIVAAVAPEILTIEEAGEEFSLILEPGR